MEGLQPVPEDASCLGTLCAQHHLHVLRLDALLVGLVGVGLCANGPHGGLYGSKQGDGVDVWVSWRGGGGVASFPLGRAQGVGRAGGVGGGEVQRVLEDGGEMGVSQERGAAGDGQDVEGAVEQSPCGAAGACVDADMARVVELLEKQTQHVLCACGDDAAEGVRAGMAGQSVPVVGEAHDAGGVVQLLVEVAVGEGLGEVEGLQACEGGREGGGRGTAQRRRRHGAVRCGAVVWCGRDDGCGLQVGLAGLAGLAVLAGLANFS